MGVSKVTISNLKVLAAAAALAVAGVAAEAAPLQFTLSGAASASFVFDSDPAQSDLLAIGGNYFKIAASGTFPNNTPVNTAILQFFDGESGGGFAMFEGGGGFKFNTFGPQIFGGSVNDPAFQTGTFSLGSYIGDRSGPYTLTITEISAVPLPASALLLMGGLLGLGALARRRGARA
ncbi:hypothetical protein GCM10017056_50690 [Seohaeicola zhoushanensis]|uniref:VPLPA-CTERM protein sorting domain-containing protein n=1 Tax=Seohaeicola zhoushanensis TaxID=1569283 RepID=A0A8J3H3N2_9RHOB|nr:hypothetical protein GCM10017056_50690 [Seohaeicola zhoushanensis]